MGMTLLLPVLFFYVWNFAPSFFSCFLPFLGILFVLSFIFRKKEKIILFLLFSVVLLHLGGQSYEECYFFSSLPTEKMVTLYGRVASAPSRRKNRGVGYRLKAYAASDEERNFYTTKGLIYVISDFSDVGIGDEVHVSGKMGDGYFLANSTGLLKRDAHGTARRRLEAILLQCFPKGEKGNLSALLLTGSSLDGTSTLTDLARSYGLSYVLALSGMHLALLALPLRPLFDKLGGEQWGKLVLFLLLSFFVYFTGWKPSLLRALLFMILSSFFEMEYSFPLTLVTMLVLYPESMGELGTSLSFVSLGGILFLSKRVSLPLRMVFPFSFGVISAITASASALAFSVPLLMGNFGGWVPLSILLAYPAGILITLVFYLIIFSIMIPKTELIMNQLLGFLPYLQEKQTMFHEVEGWKEYWWMCSTVVLLYIIGGFLEGETWMRKVKKACWNTKEFFSFLLSSP